MLGLGLCISAVAARRVGAGGGGGVPVNTAAPVISGTLAVGETLTAAGDTWDGAVDSKVWVWKRAGTVIPASVGNTCKMPPISATETITVEVTATNGSGSSAPVPSAATAAIARSYVSANLAANAGGVWSHTIAMVPGFVGNMVELVFNGVTASFAPNAKGLLDRTAVTNWWIDNGGGDYNGLMPRISKRYQQGALNAAQHLIQVTASARPMLDLNLWRDDGLIPANYSGFNARGTNLDGSALAVSEVNALMYCAALPYDSSNNTVMLIADGISNIATSNLGNRDRQNTLIGMKGATAADNCSIVAGYTSWSSNVGLGLVNSNQSTAPYGYPQHPATPLLAPASRCLISAIQTTNAAHTIDGITPTGGQGVVSIRVNNDPTQQWTALTGQTRTANPGTVANGFSVGRNGEQRAASGTNQAVYGVVMFPSSLVTDAVDTRDADYGSLMKVFAVHNEPTLDLNLFGASSVLGYSGSAGMGPASRVPELLGPRVRCNLVAMAATRNVSDFVPNKAYIATLKRAGVVSDAAIYVASSDIGGALLTGLQTYDYQMELVAAMRAEGGWRNIYVLTFVSPWYAGNVAKTAENVIYNGLVMDPANQALHDYIAIDTASIAQLQTPTATDPYFDGGSHIRGSNGLPLFGDVIAAGIAPHLP